METLGELNSSLIVEFLLTSKDVQVKPIKTAMGDHASVEKNRYNAEIVAGSLMLAESRKIAELLLKGIDDGAWHQALVIDNVLQKKSPSTAKRQSALIKKRLELMTPDLWQLVVGGTSEVATQSVFAAAIKHSHLLGDFLKCVVKAHYKVFDNQLSRKEWKTYFEEREQLEPEVGSWAESTRNKLGEVIFRVLAEARYLDSTRALRITPVVITDEVRRYLAINGEQYVLECMEITK